MQANWRTRSRSPGSWTLRTSTSPSMSDFRAQQQVAHDALKAAKTIAIIGAGPVGVELAAEIASHHPMKKVTLYAGSDTVVPGISDKLSKTLRNQIVKTGVDLRLGVMTSDLAHTDRPYSGTFTATGKPSPPIWSCRFSEPGRFCLPWRRPQRHRDA